ncbi:MAG: hypothetical protein WBY93_07745 [Candidatus Binatus sp.]
MTTGSCIWRLVVTMAIAICVASCSSNDAPPPQTGFESMQLSPAAAGSCEIDAVKMCQVLEGSSAAAPSSQTASVSTPSSVMPTTAPDSLEFQIPAGQSIKLACYFDPQHTSLYRANATADSPLTGNSVEYMKQHGFCVKK